MFVFSRFSKYENVTFLLVEVFAFDNLELFDSFSCLNMKI